MVASQFQPVKTGYEFILRCRFVTLTNQSGVQFKDAALYDVFWLFEREPKIQLMAVT
jgi:hypothetical protein